jgi:pyrimidine deaminase RibD-like protein
MNILELKVLKNSIIKNKLPKFEKTDVTEAFKKNKDETLVELQEISAYISLNNQKTKRQIKEIEKTNLPLALKTYRCLNPYVGAVLLKKEDEFYYIYGCCRDANGDDQHAEYTLLQEVIKEGTYSDDDILFTTLEPCTKDSRKSWSTSCSELIVFQKIHNVYVGSLDPNPLITGQGIKYLLENNVNPLFYTKANRDIIKENNVVFLKQFDLPKGDPQKYKDIFDSFICYMNFDTVEKYIALTIGGINTIENFKEYENKSCGEKFRDIFEFFREMVMNRSILLADREIEKFVCIKDFALFFFEEPKKIVDGSTIRIINNSTNIETSKDCSLYQVFDEIAKVMQDVFPLPEGNKPETQTQISSVEKTFKQIEEKFNLEVRKKLNESIIKELLINALVHRDYLSPIFTEITIDENYIEIRNPVTEEISNGIEEIKKYSFGSNPINGRLMRFFMDIKFCERKSHGLRLAEMYKIQYFLKDSILVARFEKNVK